MFCSLRSFPETVDRPWGFLEGCAGSETLTLIPGSNPPVHLAAPATRAAHHKHGKDSRWNRVRRTWGWLSSHLSLLSPSLIWSQAETRLFKPSCDQLELVGWCEMITFLPALSVHLPSGHHPFFQPHGSGQLHANFSCPDTACPC